MAEPATFPALLRRNRERCGDERAIVTEDRAITHAELDDASRALAARLVAAGCGKAARVGLLAPNGIEWAVTAAAVLRIGAVLVPLSTLLRPPELLAQLQTASVTHLIAATEFRGRHYLDDLEEAAPGLLAAVRGRRPPPGRAVDPRRLGPRRGAGGRRTGSAGRGARGPRPAGRRPQRAVHLGEPGHPEGRDPHPRRSPPGGGLRARRPVRAARRGALHPDAVLLDRRLRRRPADRAGRRGDAADRGRARAGPDARPPGAGAGHAVPRLAGPGGPPRPARGLRVDRPVVARRRQPAGGAPARAPTGARATGPSCSA